MIAGPEAATLELLPELERVTGVTWVTHPVVKRSFSETIPHKRMLVKLKKEIIPVGDPDVCPELSTAPHLPAKQLKAWLDEGRELTLIDTRNTYEIHAGTFKGAKHWDLESSRDFVSRATDHRHEVNEEAPVMMICTGGIRCEKATAALLKRGWKNVYQLEGGILKYFEEVGGAHYDGNCFVFDWRLALDPSLVPTFRSPDAGPSSGRHQIKS